MSLKLGLCRIKHKLCCSEFRKDLPSSSHSENDRKNQLLDNLLRPQHFLTLSWNENAISKESTLLLSKDVASKQLDLMPTEIDSNWDNT